MTRRHLLTAAAAAIAAPMVNTGRCRLFGAVRSYPIRVVDLVARSVVIDMLGLLTMDWPKLARWHSDPSSFEPGDFAQAKRSGIDILHPAVDLGTAEAFKDTLDWFNGWNSFINQCPEQFRLVQDCSGLEGAKAASQISILLGMQNSEHFRTRRDVAFFHSRGQRLSQLTYNSQNRLGSGCGVRRDTGLSEFGCGIVEAMNESGMVIDVSHAGERTTLDAIAVSRKPLLITHSNCHALVRHPRCKSDEVICAMARNGGVMGITGVRAFVSSRGRASIEDILDHFDHVAKLVGVEHIGIGSDAPVDGGRPAPHLQVHGLSHTQRVFDLAEGLARRRYSNEAIVGILGGNFNRSLQQIFCS